MVQVGTPESFRAARADLLNEEKSATRLLSSLAEKRRALPAVKVNNPSQYTFTASDGSSKTLLDLFEGRRQLILYHFMLFDKDKEGCVGCSFCMDNLPQELRHLQNRDTTMAAAAPAGIEKVNAFKERMEWKFPFYSSKDTFTKADATGEDVTWRPDVGTFAMAAFLREGDDVLHTYITQSRGVEVMLGTYALLDMTALGRQETGPNPKTSKLHDQY